MPKQRERLYLPNLKPYVDLAPVPAGLSRALIQAGDSGVSTLELQQMGFLHPTKVVSQLRKLGAVIETIYCSETGPGGTTHSGIARYVFRYWIPDFEDTNLNYDLKETA